MSHKKAALLFAILTSAFSPLIEGGTTYLPVFVIRILILIGCSFYIAGSIRSGEFDFKKTPLDRAMLLFLVMACLSAAIAPYKNMALTWGQVIFYYALFFYLTSAVFSLERSEELAIYAVMVMGAAESVWGIAQRLQGVTRPSGSFFNPNMLAGYLTPAFLITVALVVFRHRSAATAVRRAAMVFFAVLLAAAIIMTGSRGGILSLSAGFFLVLWARSRRLAAVSLLLVAAVLLVFPNPVKERFLSADIFAYSRAGIWASAVRMMVDHPMGVGLGNFKYFAPAYNFPVEEAVIRYGKIANNAHNEYLQIGAEMGLAGLAAFLYGVFLLARVVVKALRLEGEKKVLAVGISGGITAIFVHAVFDANLHEPGISLLLILLVCLLIKVSDPGGREVTLPVEARSRKRLALLCGFLVLSLVLWAGAPPLAYYYSTKAGAAAKAGNFSEALSSIDKALLIESGNASYHNQRAAFLYRDYLSGGDESRFKWSLEELDEAKRLNPSEGGYPQMKAEILYGRAAGMNSLDARKEALRKALGEAMASLRLNPYNFETRMAIARIYALGGDRDKAIGALEKLEGMEPDCLRCRVMLAGLYLEAGKRDLSKKEYDTIISTRKRMAGRDLDKNESGFTGIKEEELEGLKNALEK